MAYQRNRRSGPGSGIRRTKLNPLSTTGDLVAHARWLRERDQVLTEKLGVRRTRWLRRTKAEAARRHRKKLARKEAKVLARRGLRRLAKRGSK